jgi:hypothetical protein
MGHYHVAKGHCDHARVCPYVFGVLCTVASSSFLDTEESASQSFVSGYCDPSDGTSGAAAASWAVGQSAGGGASGSGSLSQRVYVPSSGRGLKRGRAAAHSSSEDDGGADTE